MGDKPLKRSPDDDQLARPGTVDLEVGTVGTAGGMEMRPVGLGRSGRPVGRVATSWSEARRPVDLVEKQHWNGRDGTGDQLARPVTDLAPDGPPGPGTAGGPVQSEGPVGLAWDGRRVERPVGQRPAAGGLGQIGGGQADGSQLVEEPPVEEPPVGGLGGERISDGPCEATSWSVWGRCPLADGEA